MLKAQEEREKGFLGSWRRVGSNAPDEPDEAENPIASTDECAQGGKLGGLSDEGRVAGAVWPVRIRQAGRPRAFNFPERLFASFLASKNEDPSGKRKNEITTWYMNACANE